MLDLRPLLELNYSIGILTSCKNENLNGCVVNTVFQVAPKPPLVAVSVNNNSLSCEYIVQSGCFAVSVLAESAPMTYIGRFGLHSGRDFDKFKETRYHTGKTGAPILPYQAVGFLEAKVLDSLKLDTYTVFVGEITEAGSFDHEKPAMTYRYYKEILHGKTPESAPTYVEKSVRLITSLHKGTTRMKKYRCVICGYIYDPSEGDPEGGIEPGTAFEDLPDDWVCPLCGAGKQEFEPLEQ